MDLSQLKKQSTKGKKKISKAFNESESKDVEEIDSGVPEDKGEVSPEAGSEVQDVSANQEAVGVKIESVKEASSDPGGKIVGSVEPEGVERNIVPAMTRKGKKGKSSAVQANNVFHQLDVDLGELYGEIKIEEQRNEQINLAENKKQDIEKMAAVLNVTQKDLLGVMIEKFKNDYKNVIEKIALRNVKNLF